MWMPDIMQRSESSDNYAFDALGLCSDMQYNELFDLVVDSNGSNERSVGYEEFDELKTTMLCPPTGLDSANSCGSSAGPDDQHARSREESWPAELPLAAHPPPPSSASLASLAAPPAVPVWEIRGAPTKTMHMRIPARYKGQGLASLSGTAADLPDLLMRIPVSRHRASTSLSSPTSLPPTNFSTPPITTVKNTITPSEAQTNIRSSPIPTDNIHRTLRHRKSTRDLHAARRAQLTELVKSSMTSTKMNINQQHHITPSTPAFDEMLQYSPAQNPLQSMGEIPSDVPRYTPSNPSPRPPSVLSEYMQSPFSLSAEDLNTPQYEQVTLARPHSMSSLQTTSVMPDNVDLQFTPRRASDPTDTTMFYENQTRQFSIEEYASWIATSNIGQQPFDSPLDLRMPTESPVAEINASQTWWDDSKANMEDWATQQLSGVSPGQINDVSNPLNHHHNNGSSHQSPYNPILLPHQPPSPSFDGEENSIFPHIKRSTSLCSSMPSPPESPEFHFTSQMPTPEVGFPQTPSLSQGGFNSAYSQGQSSIDIMTRRFSLPHTPSPSPHTLATAAAAVAIAATSKTPPKSISKPSSRPGSSRRKASSGSMRSQAKASVASSLSSQSNDSEMSFVNFTPNDATRILSGVAPSGSSKTKARREREALEKRRKLSEAAAAAVTAAGGDASALAQVDLL